MIISRQKEFNEILRALKEQDIFIIGCGKCAAKLHVGGEPEVLEMGKRLSQARKNVVGTAVLSSVCSISSWSEVLLKNPRIKESEALLVMSCGGGVSVISRFVKMQIYPALDTLSLGGMDGDDVIKEQCSMCGSCTLSLYGGVCPLTQCAKGLLNGPCGGAVEGKCEVDERRCAWNDIFERLKKTGRLGYLEIIHEPRDHANKFRRQN